MRWRNKSYAAVGVMLLVAAAGSAPRAAAGAEAVALTPVAVSGQAAPGAGGRAFEGFEAPSLNDDGLVSFNGVLPRPEGATLNASGIWSGSPGALSLHVLSGTTSPANSNPPYVSFTPTTSINARGDVLFGATFPPEEFAPVINGLFVGRRDQPTPPALVAATGTEAPEARSKQFFNVVETFPLRLGHGGDVAFTALLHGKEIETDVNDSAVWSGPLGGRRIVARAGDQAPGTPAGTVFAKNGFGSAGAFHQPAVDRAGNVAFVGHLRGTGIDKQNESGIWYDDGKALSLVARKGDHVLPETYIQYNGFDLNPSVANGRIAFHADLYGPPPPAEEGVAAAAARGAGGVVIQSDSDPYTAIVAGRPGAMKIVAHTRAYQPGLGYSLASLGSPALNSAGQIAYTARLRYDTDTDPAGTGHSIFAAGPGVGASGSNGGRLVVKDGDAAPGTAEGVVFRSFSDPSVNDAGWFATLADLRGTGVVPENDTGIWAGRMDGGTDAMRLVAREGQVIDLGDGLPRTVSELLFLTRSNGGEDGGPSAFNHAGQIAFVARFTDGSSAVLTGAVPEPGAAAGLGGLLAAFALRRTRRRNG